MKKIKFYLCFFGVAVFLASIGAVLAMVTDMVYTRHPDYFSVNVFAGILISVSSVWLSLLFHEFAHMAAYKISGCKIRLFYIFPMCFVKEHEKFKVSATVNPLLGLGGIVIPELPPCGSEDDIRKVYKVFRRSLIAAPVFSAILGIASLFAMIFVTDKIGGTMRSVFFIFCAFNVLAAVYINVTSLLCFAGLIGDYAAFHMLKNDPSYALVQLYNEMLLQSKNTKSKLREKRYLYNIILRYVDEIYLTKEKCIFNSGICSLIDIVFYENTIMDNVKAEETEMKILFKILKNDLKTIEERLKFETYSKFFCHMLIFMCYHEQYSKAITLWEEFSDKFPQNNNGRYCAAQLKTLFSGEKNADLNKMMYISSLDSILLCLDNYYDDEKRINWKIINKPIRYH